MISKPELRVEIVIQNPVLRDSPFGHFRFRMLAAFNCIEDIHKITLQQLLFLAEKGRMKITLRVK